jgi:hypothetical protein
MMVRFVVRCLVGGSLVLSSQFANAQIPGGATLPAPVVSGFLANPSQLLSQFPAGGPGLVKQVRDLLATDKSTLPTLITVLKLGTPDQQTAIARALAEIAKAYAQNDPAFSNQIQTAVAASGIPDVIKAYAEIAGDTGTASTGGGGGGGNGGPNGTGAPGGGPNTGAFNPGNSFAPNGFSLATGGNVGSGGFSEVSTH